MPLGFAELWAAAERCARARGAEPRNAFGDVGLFLQQPPKRWDYWCTPENSLTFASTGGDGVHYGFLAVDAPADVTPVVMTVPMADGKNVVVAENLDEFLGLGYHAGWFSLERIVYAPDEAIEYFARSDAEQWPEEAEQLDCLKRELRLTHRPLRLDRLAELHERYGRFIRAKREPDPADWRG